MSRHIIFKNCH